MYWTRGPAGVIMEAQMDGSDMIRLIDCNDRLGIAIDHDTSRIFWTEQENSRILSSDMNGTDIRTVVTLPRGSSPYGIAFHNNELYWGNWNDRSLQRSSKSGVNVSTLFRGAKNEYVRQLCITSRNFPTSRQNHCEGQNCSNIGVLTATGFHCIPWKFWILQLVCKLTLFLLTFLPSLCLLNKLGFSSSLCMGILNKFAFWFT